MSFKEDLFYEKLMDGCLLILWMCWVPKWWCFIQSRGFQIFLLLWQKMYFLNEIMHCSSISWKSRSPLSQRMEIHYPPTVPSVLRVSLLYSGRQCIMWLYKPICPDAYGQEKLYTVTYFTLKSEPLHAINYMAILLMRYLRGTLEHNDPSEKPLSEGIEGSVIGLSRWSSG